MTRECVDVAGLSLTLDYGHFIYQGMSNESVHPLLPHASHFHARGGTEGALQSTFNDNTIDFQAIVWQMKSNHYSGIICMGYVWVDWEGCNRTDNIAENLQLRDTFEKFKITQAD
jgi:sugar phosphate isomerase/epimerase